MKTLLGILLTISINSPLMAWTNASYSQRDEVAITDDLSQLIIGAFAHHGEAFYQNEIERCLRILDRDPKDFVARDDLGVAYLKLSDWEQAEATFFARTGEGIRVDTRPRRTSESCTRNAGSSIRLRGGSSGLWL
jgi:hypothetical protein